MFSHLVPSSGSLALKDEVDGANALMLLLFRILSSSGWFFWYYYDNINNNFKDFAVVVA